LLQVISTNNYDILLQLFRSNSVLFLVQMF